MVAVGGRMWGYQAITALKKWFSCNKAQQNTIDSILEDEEIPPQTAGNLFLNNVVDPDYENVRTMLKSTKRNVLLSESVRDIREREDDLERHSSQARKSEKIRRHPVTKIP